MNAMVSAYQNGIEESILTSKRLRTLVLRLQFDEMQCMRIS